MSESDYVASNDFQARLARISNGEVHSADGLIVPERREVKDVKLTGGLLENALYPLSIVGAFLLGILAVFFSRFARIHLLGTADPDTDIMLAFAADGAMALAIGFMFKQAFRMKGAEWISAQTMGVTVMVASMHNLIHLQPKLFSQIFTPDYVDAILSYTEFRTLMAAGYVLPF
ncbi:hypothetical protein [uncultured Litoreibacter sp.]|uniref:hypothetical protein n=1 Tax=uncultured Litoreibacter sp. TaxID=1392394 RepID=UPI00262250DF|nr:hypothetical protein [uncultured Litoreibacter sp.]